MSAVQGRLVEVPVEESEPAVRVPVGEEKSFRAYDPDQVLLLAPVLSEWVPEGDLAHFVSDLVETGALDLSVIYAAYEEERGFPPYDPRLIGKGATSSPTSQARARTPRFLPRHGNRPAPG